MKEYFKKNTLKRLADCVVSEEHPASGGQVVTMKKFVAFNAANVRDAVASIPCLIKGALTAMMTPGLGNEKRYSSR